MAGFKFLPPRITHPELGFALLLPAPGRRSPAADPRYGVVVRLMDKPVEIRVLIEDTADAQDQTKGPAATPKVASQLCRDWAANRVLFVFDAKISPAECRSYVDAVLEGGMYWEDPRG